MMNALERVPEALADAFTGFLGTWSVIALVCVYTGLSFDTLSWLSPLAVVAGVGCGVWSHRHAVPGSEDPPGPSQEPVGLDATWWVPAAAVLVSLLGFYQRWSHWWTYLPCVVAVAALVWQSRRRSVRVQFSPAGWKDLLAIGAIAVAGAVAVMGLRRLALDDAYHLSLIAGTLDHPELGVLSFDTMHGLLDIPLQQPIHRPQTIEMLTSLVCRLTGLDIVWVYYFVVPVSFALAMPVLQWVFLRTIDRRSAWLAVLLTFVLIMAWGGTARSVGNYAYTRFYHGKSMFLVGVVPLIAYCAVRFAQRPTRFHWLTLALSQLAAVCLTSSALVVAPPLAGLAVTSAVPGNREGLKRLALGALACLPPVLVLLLVQLDIASAGPLVSDGKMRGMRAVLGTGVQAPIALFAMLALPALVVMGRRANSVWVARYAALTFVFMLNEPLATWLGENVAELFSWRWFWGVPTAMLCGASAALAAYGLWEHRNDGRSALPALVLGLFGLFLYVGPWAHDKSSVSWKWLAPKVSMSKQELAQDVVAMATPDSNILAGPTIGWHLGTVRGHPQVVGTRKHYVMNLGRFWGPEESDLRWRLVNFADGRVTNEREVARMFDEMDARCIDVLVTGRRFRGRGFDDQLAERGFEHRDLLRGYDIWMRDIEPCN